MPGGSAHRPGYVLAVLGRFGSDQGWGQSPPLCPEVAEAFVGAGLAGRAASTKGTYRSVLRLLGGTARPAWAAPRSLVPRPGHPTAPEERAELSAMAACQRSAWRRSSAVAALALGIGAGLRAGELAAATGDDVIVSPSGVAVRVATRAGRVVPVAPPYARALASLAKGVGAGLPFLPWPGRPGLQELRQQLLLHNASRPRRPQAVLGPRPFLLSSATTWRPAPLCGNCFI